MDYLTIISTQVFERKNRVSIFNQCLINVIKVKLLFKLQGHFRNRYYLLAFVFNMAMLVFWGKNGDLKWRNNCKCAKCDINKIKW